MFCPIHPQASKKNDFYLSNIVCIERVFPSWRPGAFFLADTGGNLSMYDVYEYIKHRNRIIHIDNFFVVIGYPR